MQFKNFHEAHGDAEFSVSAQEESIKGWCYNWIIANHFSLSKYMQENNITYQDALNKLVICDVTVLADPDKSHRQKMLQQARRPSLMVQQEFIVGDRVIPLKFVHGGRISVPLLFLLCSAFSLQKTRIFDNRMRETSEEGKSSNSAKMVRRGESPLALDMISNIMAEFKCSSLCFLEPVAYKNGESVDWYIEYGDIAQNRKNALRLYKESIGTYKNCQTSVFYESAEDKMPAEELKQRLKEMHKPVEEPVKEETPNEEFPKELLAQALRGEIKMSEEEINKFLNKK